MLRHLVLTKAWNIELGSLLKRRKRKEIEGDRFGWGNSRRKRKREKFTEPDRVGAIRQRNGT